MYSFKYKEIFSKCFLMTYGQLPPQDLIDNWLTEDYCDEKCAKLQEWVVNQHNHIDEVEGIAVLESFMMIAEESVKKESFIITKEYLLDVFSEEHLELIKKYMGDWRFHF